MRNKVAKAIARNTREDNPDLSINSKTQVIDVRNAKPHTRIVVPAHYAIRKAKRNYRSLNSAKRAAYNAS